MDKHRKILKWLIALTLAFIWGNSLMLASVSGAISGWVKNILNSVIGTVGGTGISGDGVLRKIAHATEFACLGVEIKLLAQIVGKLKPSTVALCGLSAALVDETIQLFVDGRAGLVKDIWIDFGGFVLGCVIVLLICQWSSYRKNKAENRGGAKP